MGGLFELVHGYKSLSIIGMCKNAGKTTALNSLIRNYSGRAVLALTSIGRDGEKEDVISGAEKPAIFVRKGSIYATSEALLPLCEAESEIIAMTGVSTALGDVVVLKAQGDGFVELAGPSMVSQLVDLSRLFYELGAQRIVIDGAMDRKSLCSRSLADATVLCAGAACGGSIEEVVADTTHICGLLKTPEIELMDAYITEPDVPALKYTFIGNSEASFPDGTDLALALKQTDTEPRSLFVEGAVTDSLIDNLLLSTLPEGFTIVARDASRLLLSASSLRKMSALQWQLRVREGIRLAAVTVNPYTACGDCFDSKRFIDAMTKAVQVPVINVMDNE